MDPKTRTRKEALRAITHNQRLADALTEFAHACCDERERNNALIDASRVREYANQLRSHLKGID